jgi:hypothetical protein
MAESKYEMVVQTASVTFTDGTPTTWTFDNVEAGSVKFAVLLPQEKDVSRAQSGGLYFIYDLITGGIKGPGSIEIKWFVRDLKNAVDATWYAVHKAIYTNAQAFNTAMNSAISTNPTVGLQTFMLTMKITSFNFYGPSVNGIISMPVDCEDFGNFAPEGQKYTATAKYRFPTAPTIT